MSSINLDVNYYSLDDLKKLFTVTSDIPISSQELDVKISNIILNAKNKYTKEQVNNISNFLQEAKLKYRNLIDYYNIQYDNIYPLTDSLKEKMVDSKFLDKNEHAIIEKPIEIPTQTKLISVYSNSRDKTKYPTASSFEVELPQSLTDITNVSLFDFNMSFKIINISEWYQNTKFTFLLPDISGDTKFTIEYKRGQYSNNLFADTLSVLMNACVQNTLGDNYNGVDYTNYNNFHTVVSPLDGIFTIYNINDTGISDKFILPFDVPEKYPINKEQPKMIYENDDYWGLGFQMGFNKEQYTSKRDMVTLYTHGDDGNTANINAFLAQSVNSLRMLDMRQDGMAFIEIDELNGNDQTSSYGGKVNSWFARVPILYSGYEQDYGGVYGEGVSVSLERLSKLKIRLRHFNDVLIDVTNQDFDITLAVTCKK